MTQSQACFLVGRDFMWVVIYIYIYIIVPIAWQSAIVDDTRKYGNVPVSFNYILYCLALNALAFYLGSQS